MSKNLFGEEQPESTTAAPKGHFSNWKAANHYRRAPGLDYCKACKYILADSRFYKCALMGSTSSSSSDIRLSYVCDKFKKK